MIHDASITIGKAYGTPSYVVLRQRGLAWLVAEYLRLAKHHYREFVNDITTVEVGVARGVASAFGEKVSKLPSWEEREQKRQPEEPEWFKKFNVANPSRKN